MKITLDKKSITLEEAQEAKQLQKDYSEVLDKNMMEILANKACGANGNLVVIEEAEITRNNGQLTVWATVVICTYDAFYRTSFDVLQADRQQDGIDNYTVVFKRQ